MWGGPAVEYKTFAGDEESVSMSLQDVDRGVGGRGWRGEDL